MLNLLQIPLTSQGKWTLPKGKTDPGTGQTESLSCTFLEELEQICSLCVPSHLLAQIGDAAQKSFQGDMAILFFIWELWPRSGKLAFSRKESPVLSGLNPNQLKGEELPRIMQHAFVPTRTLHTETSKMVSASSPWRTVQRGRHQGNQWSKLVRVHAVGNRTWECDCRFEHCFCIVYNSRPTIYPK